MDDLIKRLRKSRESTVTVGGYKFTVRRPTDVEAISLHRGGAAPADIAAEYVTGWQRADGSPVQVADIVPSGGSDPVPFDPDLWAEWVPDRPDFWGPITEAVLDAYKLHQDRRETTEKK